MHFIKTLFLLLTIHTALQAQIHIKGKVGPGGEPFVTLKLNQVSIFDSVSNVVRIPVDQYFNFKSQIPADSFVYGTISYSGFFHSFFFEKGDSLTIDINGDFIQYRGKGESNNNFYYQNLEKYKVYDISTIYRKTLAPDSTLRIYQDKRARRKALFELNKHKLSKVFVRQFELFDKLEYEAFLINYPSWYESYHSTDTLTSLSSNKFHAMQQIWAYIDQSLAQQPVYLDNINQLLFNKARQIYSSNKSINLRDSYIDLAFDSLSGKVREYFIARIICNKLTMNQQFDTMLYQRFLSIHPDIELTRNVEKKIEQLQNSPAKVTSDKWTESIVSNTNTRDTSISAILEQHKGQILYIDFWSLGCGPCRDEMPNSVALRERMKDIPVVFLYFSLDKPSQISISRSVQLIKSSQTLYFLKKQLSNHAYGEINLDAIPRYILLNTQGRIFESDAPRPGSPTLELRIRQLAGF